METKKKTFLTAAVAGILAVGTFANAGVILADEVPCFGINACKGQGACATQKHSCGGQNACKGQSWIHAKSASECTQQGGTVYTVPAH